MDRIRLDHLFATSSERNRRALLMLAGFIGLLILVAAVLSAAG